MKKLITTVVFAVLMTAQSLYAADTKVSALTELATTPADSDELYINDGGTSKKIQYSNLTGNKLNTADIDDTPVDSETAAPISSNWAYDHVNSDSHTIYGALAQDETVNDNFRPNLSLIQPPPGRATRFMNAKPDASRPASTMVTPWVSWKVS